MKIIWLGHGSFRIEIEDQVLLIDPWLNGNPMMEGRDHDAAFLSRFGPHVDDPISRLHHIQIVFN